MLLEVLLHSKLFPTSFTDICLLSSMDQLMSRKIDFVFEMFLANRTEKMPLLSMNQ